MGFVTGPLHSGYKEEAVCYTLNGMSPIGAKKQRRYGLLLNIIEHNS